IPHGKPRPPHDHDCCHHHTAGGSSEKEARMTPSRRLLLSFVGSLVPLPVLARLPFRLRGGDTGGAVPPRQSAIRIGSWLAKQGWTEERLDAVDGGSGGVGSDLVTSFRQHKLIMVDGFMIPVGFCRYCLMAYRVDGGATAARNLT